MTRLQFWILTGTIILIAPLFFTEIFLNRLVQNDERKLAVLEKVAQEGNGYTTRWQKLAVRTYQLSQQDPILKDVLTLNQIDVKPQPPAHSPGPTAPEPASK